MGWGTEGAWLDTAWSKGFQELRGKSFQLSQESWGWELCPLIPILFRVVVVHTTSRIPRKSISIWDSHFELRPFTHEQNPAPATSLAWNSKGHPKPSHPIPCLFQRNRFSSCEPTCTRPGVCLQPTAVASQIPLHGFSSSPRASAPR